MIKRILLFIGLAAVVGTAVPNNAVADRCTRGRITALTFAVEPVQPVGDKPYYVRLGSMTVREDEDLTFSLDGRTRYTKWITQGPWQEQTGLSADALYIGELVYVHQRHDGTDAARWVQIATDAR